MGKARVRACISDTGLTRSEWEAAIQEAALGIEDTRIAELYLLDAVPQIDIGEELGLSRSAISKRLLKIVDRIERTARKLHMI